VKKKLFSGMAVTMLLAVAAAVNAKPTQAIWPSAPLVQPGAIPVGSVMPSEGRGAMGLVVDVSDSLDEMARHSDLIVIAEVVEQRQFSSLAVASTVTVLNSVKGEPPTSPIILQLGALTERSEHLLEVGPKYFLFLGKQGDGSPNTFYVKGEYQGIFSLHQNKLKGEPKFIAELPLDKGTDPFQLLEQAVDRAIDGLGD
jgi:hypothetical protein